MRIRKTRSGMEEYLRRVSAGLSGTRAQKRAQLEKIRAALCEIPHAETMSLEILAAAAGAPEAFAAVCEQAAPSRAGKRRSLRLCIAAVLCCAALFIVFQLGMAYGAEKQSSQWDGYVQSYRLEDGMLDELMLEMPERCFQKLPKEVQRLWDEKRG